MNLSLGQNLKAYRLQRALTQEQLAETLGVSPQAVSRWENGAAYPDISLLPGIANFYGISLDELFGMEELRESLRLGDIFSKAGACRADGRLTEAEGILRDALRVYPNHHGLMSELALTLTLHEAAEETHLNEAVSLSERVLEESTNGKLRATTIANLCFLYLKVKQYAKAEALVKTLPHIWECRELLLAELTGDSLYPTALKQAVQRVLCVLCERIEDLPSHSQGNPGRIISSGVSFDSEVPPQKQLQSIAQFLNT